MSKPANTRFVDARAKSKFKSAGWYKLLQKFSRENVALAQPFAEPFDGEKVMLGRKIFSISEAIIAHATQSSATGERWFKNKAMLEESRNTSHAKGGFLLFIVIV